MFYYLQEMHFRARFEGKYHWVCLSGAKVATKAPVLGSCVIFLTQAHSFLQYTCSCRSFRKKWVLIPTQVHACNFTAICSCHSNANVCSGFSLQSRKSSKVGQGCFWIPKLKLSPLYMWPRSWMPLLSNTKLERWMNQWQILHHQWDSWSLKWYKTFLHRALCKFRHTVMDQKWWTLKTPCPMFFWRSRVQTQLLLNRYWATHSLWFISFVRCGW